MVKRSVRIALLLCDTPMPQVVAKYGDYHQIFQEWLMSALASYPESAISADVDVRIDGFDVVEKREYPPLDSLRPNAVDGYDVLMLTGSKHDAYDNSNPIIPPLVDFVRQIAQTPQTQHIKLVGICFGHQIISLAIGGSCVRGEQGWEVGVYGCRLTEEGKYWWAGDVAGEGGEEAIYLEQMHRDHVPSLPPACQLLATTSRYPIHSFSRLHPLSTAEAPLAQILTCQGHPEMTPDIVSMMVEVRAQNGVFSPEAAAEARRRSGGKDGTGGEGNGRVGWAIWRMMLQDLPVQLARGSGDEDIEMGAMNGVGHNDVEGCDLEAYLADERRNEAVNRVLDRPGPWTAEEFVGGQDTKSFLRSQAKILVIGAGGLGCEILQNLALTGFSDIHVIDMDTIDISNLNRQFLFRESDVGKSKAIVAAKFVMSRVPGITVTPYHGKIQDHPPSFYKRFNLVIAGLDSISARRWMNATLVQMVDEEDPESLKPLIDGGTEGFKGQARVILPTITSCYECSIDTLAPPTAYPICTIANTPRLPEHCIEWASVLEWPKVFKERKLDTDDPDHIEWLYKQASERAAEFKIDGVTWALTQGVVKNIIPAIASTNAIIAASCCNEAFKIATSCAPFLDNYMMYTGSDSVYTYTFQYDQRPDCPVCGGESLSAEVGKDWTLERLVTWLSERQDMQISRPSLAYADGKPLYYQAPPAMHEATKGNLEKLVKELIVDGDEVVVTDPTLPFTLTVTITYV